MTRKDIIENLKNKLNDLHNGYQTYLEHGGKQDIETENDIEALNMAIEALKEPEMKTNDLVELRSQIKSGMLRPFVNSGKIYLEDTASGEVIIVCELKEGEK